MLRIRKKVLLAQRLVSFGQFSDNFEIGKKLGEGAFATVFKATAKGKGGAAAAAGKEGLPPPPTEFAVKRITREGLKDEDKQSVYDEVRGVAYTRYSVSERPMYHAACKDENRS